MAKAAFWTKAQSLVLFYKRDVAFQPLFGYKKVGIYQIHRNGVPKNYFFQ